MELYTMKSEFYHVQFFKKQNQRMVGDPRTEWRLVQMNLTGLQMFNLISLKRLGGKEI